MTDHCITNHLATDILIVQTSFLGDTVLSTPVVAAVKQRHPESRIWMLTTPGGAELVWRDPLLSGVIVFDKRSVHRGLRGMMRIASVLRERRFAQVYSLHRSFRTAIMLWLSGISQRIGFVGAGFSWLYSTRRSRDRRLHDVLRNLSLVIDQPEEGAPISELRLFAPSNAEVGSETSSVVRGAGRYAVVAPGSVWRTKMWDAGHYRSIAQRLIGSGFRVVVVGGPGEVAVCAEVARDLAVVNLAGRGSIGDLLYLVSRAALVVCNDSMVLHVASAFKVPTVTVFCATSPSFGFGPWRNRARVVEHEGLSCKPCRPHGSAICPMGTDACMRDLPPERVWQAITEVLG